MIRHMGPTKCAYFALVLLFLFAACLCETTVEAYAYPRRLLDGNAAAVTRAQAVSTINAAHTDVITPKIDTKNSRKMVGQKVKVEEGTRSSPNTLQEKNCGGEHVECNQESSTNFAKGVDKSGFVAFNEDYHPPRHHPPKNN